VIAGERADRCSGDDERQRLVARRREDAGGDDQALARDDREEPVDRGDRGQGAQAMVNSARGVGAAPLVHRSHPGDSSCWPPSMS
jgi:hypothetical protein